MLFRVCASQIVQARKSLQAFAKKAQKLGLGRIEWTEGAAVRHIVEVNTLERDQSGRSVDRTTKQSFIVIPVDVTGIDEIKLGDWSIVGTVALIDGIRIASDAIQIAQLNAHSFRCDHCHHDRKRTRNYLLRNGASEASERWIGTSCLSDYTGHSVKDALAAVALYDALFVDLRDKEMSDGEGGAHAKTYDLETALAVASDEIAANGFAKSDANRPTKEIVWELLAAKAEPSEKGIETANGAIEWIQSMSDAQLIESSYMQNCAEIVRAGYVTGRLMGIAVSIIASFTKAQAKRKELETTPISKHIGTKGKRETFELTYRKHVSFPTEYGTKHLIFMADQAGNVVKWGTTNFIPSTIDLDRPFRCTATIKEHSDYKGTLQTEVSRAKFEQV